jgi:hypothetical protein
MGLLVTRLPESMVAFTFHNDKYDALGGANIKRNPVLITKAYPHSYNYGVTHNTNWEATKSGL